jgi:hypothetical protein
MNISHKGIATGRGIPFALAAALKVAPGQQANFEHFNKLAARTAVQGECNLTTAGAKAVGVIVDVSSKGDSCTIETAGFEFVQMADVAGIGIGDYVTVGADGLAVAIAGEAPSLAELTAGVWQVDQIDVAKKQVLVDLG